MRVSLAPMSVSLVALSLFLPPGGPPATSPRLALPARPVADFNHDLAADLAVGVPSESQGATTSMGAFNVLYGDRGGGLQAGTNDVWGQMSNPAETGDNFALSLAAGDFDGDGYVDLAVGIPYEDLAGTAPITNAGAVEVWYGSAAGLSSASAEFWHQNVGTVQGGSEAGDLFGYALAAGDFDADGYDDLVIGVPYEDVVEEDCGMVQVLYGSSSGLTDVGNALFRQGLGLITEPEESGDRFGKALAVGDFDGDGYDDLAIGAPDENLEGPPDKADAGVVHILYGSNAGLWSIGWHMLTLVSGDAYDAFGRALSAGDFNGDGYDDLAVGAPGNDLSGPVLDGGSVTVFFGESNGLVGGFEGYQDANPEHFDEYGSALSAADYNNDGRDDLAVGVPKEDIATVQDAGAVEILYGAPSGLVRRVSNDLWHQDRSGVEDVAEIGDGFGYAVASGDFNGDGYADLVAGIPGEEIGGAPGAGAAEVLYGSADGIRASGSWFFHQGLPAIEGAAESGDHFGEALAAIPRATEIVRLPLTLRS